ncbi:hypothetical protein [Candidatus Nitrosocosmicus arcticus]|uniref:Uncharacterized protein n=1 Tax=Candidatus Nitrosocosmicus arcticus TaxID=2035267 RepID=A0A557SWF0_9ARCH|nr:hypothetical protein [Candidatus Nitrosocosmicus arcticus]TVP40923.1 hypothetical protein NARC_50104 [Candidatus Nitrosocosmicus arcticus]
MEKSQKIIVVSSIPILIITIVVVGLLAPSAFEEQCKQKASEVINSLYALEGNKENFLASYEQGTISNRSQEELQKLDMILNNCPGLKAQSTAGLGYSVSFLHV